MAFAAPLAAGLAVAGQVVGTVSQYQAGRHNAAVDDANADGALREGAAQELDIGRRERALQGDALASQGASGLQLGTGSALALLKQNAINAQYDVLNARTGAAGKATAYRAQAEEARRQATAGLVGGMLSAGAKALSMSGGSPSPGATPGGSAMPMPIPSLMAPRDLSMSNWSLSGGFGGGS